MEPVPDDEVSSSFNCGTLINRYQAMLDKPLYHWSHVNIANHGNSNSRRSSKIILLVFPLFLLQ